MRRRPIAMVISLLALAAAGCSKGKADGADPITGTVFGWSQAGFAPSAFAPADAKPFGATSCRAGTVNGIDATLCEYPAEASAKQAEPVGLARIGDTTGVSVSQGRLLLVLADRHAADPNGKKINDILKSFRQKK
jgi:hypothetical protein